MTVWDRLEERLSPYDNVLLLVQDVLLVLVFAGFLVAAWKAVLVGQQIDANGCQAVCQSVYNQCHSTSSQQLNFTNFTMN